MFQVYLSKPTSTNLQLMGTFTTVEDAWAYVDDPGNAWLVMMGGEGSTLKVFSVTAAEVTR